jgi:hypothetical protein
MTGFVFNFCIQRKRLFLLWFSTSNSSTTTIITKNKEKEKLQIHEEFKNWGNKPALGMVWNFNRSLQLVWLGDLAEREV